MARAQTVKKKGRSSSSAKPAKGRKTSGRPAAQRDRPTQKGMVGSKGKGRQAGGQGGTADADGQRTWTGEDSGVKPEGSIPPTLVAADATVAEQRRAASRQGDGDRTNRPETPTPRKPGARGGGDFDRDAARRAGRGDPLETGRKDLTPPERESTRGPEPKGRDDQTRGDGAGQGGRDGREARSRRAGLGFRDDE